MTKSTCDLISCRWSGSSTEGEMKLQWQSASSAGSRYGGVCIGSTPFTRPYITYRTYIHTPHSDDLLGYARWQHKLKHTYSCKETPKYENAKKTKTPKFLSKQQIRDPLTKRSHYVLQSIIICTYVSPLREEWPQKFQITLVSNR